LSSGPGGQDRGAAPRAFCAVAKDASGEILLAEIRDKVWQERGQRIENAWIPANSIIASGNNEQ